jgi:hypothetical protein
MTATALDTKATGDAKMRMTTHFAEEKYQFDKILQTFG